MITVAEAAAMAVSAGIALGPEHRDELAAALDRDAGHWAQFRVACRQDDVILARELAGMFLLGEHVLDVSASHGLAERRFARYSQAVARSSQLASRVTRVHGYLGDQLIAARSGEIRFLAPPSYRGYSADLLVLRDGMDRDYKLAAAVLPCAAGRPDPQVWVT